MTALATDVTVPHRLPGRSVWTLNVGDEVFAGGLVGQDADGLLIPWDDAAASVFVGIALEGVAQSSTLLTAPVNDAGAIITNIPIASGTQTTVGLRVHCTTDNVLTDCVLDAGATSRGIGIIIRFRSAGDMDIQLYSHAVWQARYLQGTT